MSLLIEKPGILTTIQDLGRTGARALGINPGGVMDTAAARLVNILIGNDDNEAVLEMHFPAPQIKFKAGVIIAIGGADFAPMLDDQPVKNWQPIFAKKGTTLRWTAKESGNRGYLAVRGGFKITPWLGSNATNLSAAIGGFEGRKLLTGDEIGVKRKVRSAAVVKRLMVSQALVPLYRPFPTVRVVAGAEFEHLDAAGKKSLFGQDLTVSSNSNRMGFRLSGEPIKLSKPRDFISSAVSFGTIQLLPDGQLIVLMADHQTTGGYPRIAHIISRDLPLMAQLGANDKVAFHLVELGEAEQLALEWERELSFFRVGCRFQALSWT